MRRIIAAAAGLLGLVAVLLQPVPAATAAGVDGSIVFIRNHQVWISDGTGAHARRLTTQGTAAKPFRYPSESDNGVIVAALGNGFVVLDRVGHVLHSYAQPLVATGVLEYASISPDGSKVAFTVLAMRNICDPYCGFESVHAMYYLKTSTGKLLDYHSGADVNTGSWVTNSRMVLGGTVTKVYYQDPAGADEKLWYQDCDDVLANCSQSVESNYWNVFPTVNRAGNRYASVVVDEAYGSDTTDRDTFLNVMDTGSFTSGRPPVTPTNRCSLSGSVTSSSDGFPGISQATIQTPSWGPNGRSLVASFRSDAGRWQVWRIDTGADVTNCGAYDGDAILDNATQPRWSRAPLGPSKVATTTSLRVSKHKVKRHHRITLTAHVRPTLATGKVTFRNGKKRLKRVTLRHGTAKVKVRLSRGKHHLRAVYGGDTRDGGSRSRSVTVRVR